MGRSRRRKKVQQPARQSSGEEVAQRGLYDPRFEHDACGVGFVAHVKGQRSHAIVADGLTVLENMATAARAAPSRTPATARAFSSNYLTRFLPTRPANQEFN
jgi:hypothetical protein